MPIIFEPNDLTITKKNGATVAVLADYSKLGTNALHVERIEIKGAAKTSLYKAEETERFIYVIRGSGQAYIGEQRYPLQPESVLWLDKQDTFYLGADSDELDVLLCHAPASVERKSSAMTE